MADVSAQHSTEDLWSLYLENVDYDLTDSTAKASTFIQVVRALLMRPLRRVDSAGKGEAVEVEPRILQDQLRAAEAWYFSRLQRNASVQHTPQENWRYD